MGMREEEKMKDYIAYCGLDCEVCEARIATVNHDEALRQKVAALWSELNGVTITPEMIRCEGCRIDGVKTPYCDALCPIRRCAAEKGVETCGSCAGMDGCEKLAAVTAGNPAALENLKGRSRKEDCPCTKDCVRHGYCAECREHHAAYGKPTACEREKGQQALRK